MKTSFIVCLLLWSVTFLAYAGDYVVYDTVDGVTGVIVQRYRSVDGNHPVNQLPKHLKINRATYNSLTRWKKVSSGQIVDMSQAEKNLILQAEADAQAQAIEDALQNYNVSNLELLTALVQRINIRIPSNPITKNEILQQIRDNR